MRNIDYRALYEKVQKNQDAVDPRKRKGTYDNKTHLQRTQDAIDGNKARKTAQELEKRGVGTGKKAVAPVEPANLKVAEETFQEKCQQLIDEGYCSNLEEVYRLLEILAG